MSVVRHRVRAEDDDWNVLGVAVRFQLRRCVPAVHAGQPEVHQDEIRLLGARDRHGLVSVAGDDDAVVSALEPARERIAACLVVFDQKHSLHH